MDEGLQIEYAEHGGVQEMADIVRYCVESISLEFEEWDEPHVRGPGLYFIIVAGTSVADYADSMGANYWPVEECRSVTDEIDSFFDAASDVAIECDGAVVINVDGTILRQMVRLKDLTDTELQAHEGSLDYQDWMGARHMSALDTSLRDEVVMAITLSEETGRVTVFRDGQFEDYERPNLGAPWTLD